MASHALPSRSRPLARHLLAELVSRQRTLASYGGAMLGLALVAVAMQSIDPRLLDNGVNVWVKPAKFFSSVGIFALTSAWFFGYVRPGRRRAPMLRATAAMIVVAGTVELAWICWQAAHGLESHFNNDTIFFSIMYSVMGLFAVLLVGTTLPLAWEIGRRPAAHLRTDFVAAVVIGLVLTFLLGGGLGGYMSAQPGHAMGLEGGHVPLFGWNRSGGDLRIAHFLGIHAEQGLPVLAAIVAGMASRVRWAVILGGAVLYVVVTLAIFAQAVAGHPLLPL